MKPICANDTIQIEITNFCPKSCANCTRFTGLIKPPFFMDFDQFKQAVDSLVEFPNMTGMTGGDPLLHPEFEQFCEYALSKIPRERLGLWTCLPQGKEKYREIIVKTFGNIFINDHTRQDIYHHPFLVAAKDAFADEYLMWAAIDKCFFQQAWSASINPKGAFFCEMAASFSMLYRDSGFGWPVEPGWWKRAPKDYADQIDEYCAFCGGALCLNRRRSTDRDMYDISSSNMGRLLKNKIDILGKYRIHNAAQVACDKQEPLASYKDQGYRNMIAARYGIFLTTNVKCFNEPHLMNDPKDSGSILSKYRERYG